MGAVRTAPQRTAPQRSAPPEKMPKRQRVADENEGTPFDSIKSRLSSSSATTRKVSSSERDSATQAPAQPPPRLTGPTRRVPARRRRSRT